MALHWTWLNSSLPSDAISQTWIDIGSGNSLLPDSINPWSEPILSYHQRSPVVFTRGQFHNKYLRYQSLKYVANYAFKNVTKAPTGSLSSNTTPSLVQISTTMHAPSLMMVIQYIVTSMWFCPYSRWPGCPVLTPGRNTWTSWRKNYMRMMRYRKQLANKAL